MTAFETSTIVETFYVKELEEKVRILEACLENKDKVISFRVTNRFHDRLKSAAKEKRVTITTLIHQCLLRQGY